MRSIVFLGMTLLAASVGIGQNHPSLPSSFRATTIHSLKGADANLADVPTPAGPTPRQLGCEHLVQLEVGEQQRSDCQ
jgi:hypothetical protein